MIFNCQDYTVRVIDTPTYGVVQVADITLSDALLDWDMEYVNDKAREIDKGIFYYVETEYINLPQNELIEIVEEGVRYKG
jgi:hypothetical protein